MKKIESKNSVLFVTEFYRPHVGGGELLMAMIAEELVKRGHRIGVITALLPNTEKYELLNGVEVHRVWVPNFGARYFFTLLGIFSVLRHGRAYDIFQTTVYNAALPAILGGFIFRKRVFVIVHEAWGKLWFRLPGMTRPLQWLLYWFERVILSLPFEKFICVSQSTLKNLRAIKPTITNRSLLIYNGLDYSDSFLQSEKTEQKKKGKKCILFYGRPGISKGVEYMISSLNEVQNKNVDFRLIISGDDQARYNHMRSLITNPALHIEPTLKRMELKHAIEAADYVIVPSLSEGFGFVALEACILGKALICSDQTALPEVVYGKVAFYNPWNTSELTAICNDLDNKHFKTIPKREFHIEDTAEEYLKLY